VWVAGDTLYFGAYDGGFHAFDISGELRGDLMAQGRQIAHVYTADMDGNTKNHAQTWGVVVNPKDGLAYVNDFNNGSGSCAESRGRRSCRSYPVVALTTREPRCVPRRSPGLSRRRSSHCTRDGSERAAIIGAPALLPFPTP
jgi:hypothetical protein